MSLEFRRTADADTYVVEPHFARPMTLRLQIPAVTETPRVRLNGRVILAKRLKIPAGAPRIEFVCPAADRSEISITWTGELCCPAPEPEETVKTSAGPRANASALTRSLPRTSTRSISPRTTTIG